MTKERLPSESSEYTNVISAGNRVRRTRRPARPLAALVGVAVLTAIAAISPVQRAGSVRPPFASSAAKQPRTNKGDGQFELVVLDNGKPFTGAYAIIWDGDTNAPVHYRGISESGGAPVPAGPHSLVIGEASTIGDATLPNYPSDIKFITPPEKIEFDIRAGQLAILYVNMASIAQTGLWPPGGSSEVFRPEINSLE